MPTGPHAVVELGRLLAELSEESEEIRGLLASSRMGGRVPVLLGADPPAHTRQRNLVNRAFSPPRVRQIEDSIRDIAEKLVDAFVDDGHVELVKQFAVPLPLTVIAHALGVPDDDLDTFKRWSDDFVVLVGQPQAAQGAHRRLRAQPPRVHRVLRSQDRRSPRRPQDDLISDVVTARLDGEELSEEEMLAMFSQFLVAGNETTTKHLAATMWLLCEHPEAMAQVHDDPSLVTNLVEESLRLETPVQGLYRTATRDAEIGGVAIPEGAHVMVMYAAATGTTLSTASPTTSTCAGPTRRPIWPSAKGRTSASAALARSESRIAVETLLGRLEDIRLAPGNTFEMEPTYVLHGFKELHLTFRPR